MPVLACNITNETLMILDGLLKTPQVLEFAARNRLNITDKTILLRAALYNFLKHLPPVTEVAEYKYGLLRPYEFDYILQQLLNNTETKQQTTNSIGI